MTKPLSEHTFVHAAADFLCGVETGTGAEPIFRSALETQKSLRCDPPVGQGRQVGRNRRRRLSWRSSAARMAVMAAGT